MNTKSLGLRAVKRLSAVLSVLAVATLALSPAPADARAGGGSSSGSRGSYTYSPPPATRTAPSAAPMQRSMTPQTPTYNRPDYSQPQTAGARSGGLFGGGFGGMLMGGLLGAGLFGLLSGGGFFSGAGFGGLLGTILQLVIVFWLVRMALRFFRGRAQPQASGAPYDAGDTYQRTGNSGFPPIRDIGGGTAGAGFGHAAPPAETAPLTLEKSDFDAFEALLIDVQAAWSRSDMEGMRRQLTGEMYGYFGEELQALASRSEVNTVTNVKLEQGDLAQAWRENGRDYATVAMRFSMLDVTRNVNTGVVVAGHDTERSEATEIWTFTRLPLQSWQLSAIQQTQ